MKILPVSSSGIFLKSGSFKSASRFAISACLDCCTFDSTLTILYEFSLNFLSDQENCVADTLQRLAVFKEAELNAESSPEKIEAVLASATAERLRFFDF